MARLLLAGRDSGWRHPDAPARRGGPSRLSQWPAGDVHADYCPHRGWPFDGGYVRNGVLTCPFHGYEFSLVTGECLWSPDLPLAMYPVRIRDGRVEIKLK